MNANAIQAGKTYESHTKGKRRKVLRIVLNGHNNVEYFDLRFPKLKQMVTLKAFAQWAGSEVPNA